jgi:hypothetical protein
MNIYGKGKLINKKIEFSEKFHKDLKHFTEKLPENSIVECFMELSSDDGSLPQLAKIHAMLKDISLQTGISVEDLKLVIKEKAGLCVIREISNKQYFLAKSFGDCSKEELNLAIQAINDFISFLQCPQQNPVL